MTSFLNSVSGRHRLHVIGCRVLESALRPLLEELPNLASCRFMDSGLHTVPDALTARLQEAIDDCREPGYVLLGYGLCGNGLVGLKSRRHHLVVPRVDDCIPLLLGSYQAYLDNLQVHPGTYFLSRGWLESEQHPAAQLAEWSDRYGRAQAEKLLHRMYRHYQRVAFVALDESELPRYRPQAQAVADLLGVDYVEIIGTPHLLRRLVRYQDSGSSQDLILAPPGTTLTQRPFVRA